MNKYIVLSAAVAMLCACSKNEFKVDGTIANAPENTGMVVENAQSGVWFIVDSVKTDGNGKFSFSAPAPQYPGIYRLRCGEQSIYFPIDSLDNIHIETSFDAFASAFTLSGSANAEAIMNVDKKAMELQKSNDTAAFEAWKKEMANQVVADAGSIVSYYIINKQIGSQPLFDPLNNQDIKIIGAVANAFHIFRPNDPRTNYLVELLLNAQRRRRLENGTVPADTLQAAEIGIFNISLQDKNGKMQDLENICGKGKVVVLNFTLYNSEFSPILNKVLSDAYTKYGKERMEIFQVAYDSDEFAWREMAKNIPWITMLDSYGASSPNLQNYNVGALPVIFIIDGEGNIRERIVDFSSFSSVIAKYL